MRPVPISDELVEASVNGRREVIGEPGDPTNMVIRPVEYLVRPSILYPGRSTYTAVIKLDDEDRKLIAQGAILTLTLDGGELPWELELHI